MHVQHTSFPLGRLVATQNALDVIPSSDIHTALDRHQRGDWGDVCKEDRAANDAAIVEGSRILSVYKTAAGNPFWIITEWDRSATTILLPEDY